MLRATTACNFSSLIWPAGSAPAASSGATNHWKNTVFRDFPTFSRICIFFRLTLSLLLFSLLIFLFSLPLPYSAFHLSILSEVLLLNFLRIVGQRTSRICSCAEIIKKCTGSLLGAWISPHLGVCMCVCVAQGLKSLSKGKMTICFHFLCAKLLWSDLLLELESKKIQA